MDERTTTPERDAASERLRAFGARLERIGLDDLRQLVLSPTAADDRAEARATADRAIEAAGLGDVADEALVTVRAYMDRVYVGGAYHPTWVAPNWGLSTGSVEDRVAATMAVEDAALATIAEGLAPDAVVVTLRAPFELIADAHPMPLGGDAPPTLGDVRRLGPVWGSVAIVLLALAAVGWFVNAWPVALGVAVGGALAVGRWWRSRRARETA